MPDRLNLLVAYDVNTLTKPGRARLRRVAKLCEGLGQRVQYSVFECAVSETRWLEFRRALLAAIDPQEDSLRLYFLRGPRDQCVEAHGRDTWVDFQAPLIL